MRSKTKGQPGRDEIPLEKRIMEVILTLVVIVTMVYFFLVIVVL